MSEQLPIIEQLEQADRFSTIANWLTRCPLAIFASHGAEIEAILAARFFNKGLYYAQCYIAELHRTRAGLFIPSQTLSVDGDGGASKELVALAERLDQAVEMTADKDLSWHQYRKPQEATNAG